MTDVHLEKILNVVHIERGLDFTLYKRRLLSRRVQVRVRATGNKDFETYLKTLKTDPEEMDRLLNVLTINVTEFFRDSHVFDAIGEKLIPEIVRKKRISGNRKIRIWSCACSSGEEPYSILMMLAEYLHASFEQFDIAIIGTDIDNGALAKAREGVFEASQFAKLNPERKQLINKYFYDMGNQRYWIRELWPHYLDIRFHDAISYPPFEDIDIALCRNFLMYLDRDLQNQVIENLWASLNDDGFLILGNVESIVGDMRDKVVDYDSSARIYRKLK